MVAPLLRPEAEGGKSGHRAGVGTCGRWRPRSRGQRLGDVRGAEARAQPPCSLARIPGIGALTWRAPAAHKLPFLTPSSASCAQRVVRGQCPGGRVLCPPLAVLRGCTDALPPSPRFQLAKNQVLRAFCASLEGTSQVRRGCLDRGWDEVRPHRATHKLRLRAPWPPLPGLSGGSFCPVAVQPKPAGTLHSWHASLTPSPRATRQAVTLEEKT